MAWALLSALTLLLYQVPSVWIICQSVSIRDVTRSYEVDLWKVKYLCRICRGIMWALFGIWLWNMINPYRRQEAHLVHYETLVNNGGLNELRIREWTHCMRISRYTVCMCYYVKRSVLHQQPRKKHHAISILDSMVKVSFLAFLSSKIPTYKEKICVWSCHLLHSIEMCLLNMVILLLVMYTCKI